MSGELTCRVVVIDPSWLENCKGERERERDGQKSYPPLAEAEPSIQGPLLQQTLEKSVALCSGMDAEIRADNLSHDCTG